MAGIPLVQPEGEKPRRLSIANRIEQIQNEIRQADAKEMQERSLRIEIAHELFAELGMLVGAGRAFIRTVTSQAEIIMVYLHDGRRMDYKVISEDEFSVSVYPDGDSEKRTRVEVLNDWLRMLGMKVP